MKGEGVAPTPAPHPPYVTQIHDNFTRQASRRRQRRRVANSPAGGGTQRWHDLRGTSVSSRPGPFLLPGFQGGALIFRGQEPVFVSQPGIWQEYQRLCFYFVVVFGHDHEFAGFK